MAAATMTDPTTIPAVANLLPELDELSLEAGEDVVAGAEVVDEAVPVVLVPIGRLVRVGLTPPDVGTAEVEAEDVWEEVSAVEEVGGVPAEVEGGVAPVEETVVLSGSGVVDVGQAGSKGPPQESWATALEASTATKRRAITDFDRMIVVVVGT